MDVPLGHLPPDIFPPKSETYDISPMPKHSSRLLCKGQMSVSRNAAQYPLLDLKAPESVCDWLSRRVPWK